MFSFTNMSNFRFHCSATQSKSSKVVKSSRVKVRRKFPAHCLPLACNVVAASRRRGFHKGSGGRQTSKSAQNCLRAYTPACVKPLVNCWRFYDIPNVHTSYFAM